jgi:hypothetical protein
MLTASVSAMTTLKTKQTTPVPKNVAMKGTLMTVTLIAFIVAIPC